ncbi:MAG TPA: hypothetical protein VH476_03235, partial [Solirubrobacterales bacterium]
MVIAGVGLSAGLSLLLAAISVAAPPTLTVSGTDAVVGGAIHASAQLAEAPSASGEISFEIFGPGDPTCSGSALTPTPAAASVEGEGEYSSGDFDPAEPGSYSWSAHYSGDLENEPADSTCSAVSTVAKASPGLAGTATSAVVVGATITDSVTVSGGFETGGSLTFRAFGPNDATCAGATQYEATVAVSGNGPYSPAGFAPPAGTYRWTASYSGDANNETASLPCNSANQTSTVAKKSPGLAGTATSAVVVGATISDSVTVSGGFETGGNLVFRAFGPNDATCAGAVKYEATVAVSGNGPYSPAGFSPAPGAYRWTVSYSGDANNEAASLPCNSANQSSTVAKKSLGLAGTATSAVVVGATISDSVTVSGGFETGGSLTFRAFGPNDATCAGAVKYEATVAVSGNGPYSPAGFAPPAGTYRWTVSYSGDANNEAASLPCNSANQSSTVAKKSPGLAGTATSAVVGATISDSVTVSGGFETGGSLTFRAFGPNDATCAGAVKYEATVAVSGNGPYSPAGFAPPAGTYRWTVSYSGDANNEAASLPCNSANQSSTVAKKSPGLAGTATSAVVGATITDSVTVSGGFQPGGELTFQAFGPNDETCAGAVKYEATVAVSGNGPYSPAGFAPPAGLYRWTVSYSGDANNEAASLPCNSANQSSTVAKA